MILSKVMKRRTVTFSFEKVCTLSASVGLLTLFFVLTTLSAEETHPFVALYDDTTKSIYLQGTVHSIIPSNKSTLLILHSTITIPVAVDQKNPLPKELIGKTVDVQGTLGGNSTEPIIFGSALRLR